MKTVVRMILVAALACGSGCAKPDWIEQTLVTVDVTGTWEGSTPGGPGGSYELVLEQEGAKVTGTIVTRGFTLRNAKGSLDGTVAGDVFTFQAG
jgi:hypothetical protein